MMAADALLNLVSNLTLIEAGVIIIINKKIPSFGFLIPYCSM